MDLEKLAEQQKALARVVVINSIFTNLIIKKLGITNNELQTAIVKASITDAEAQLVRSQAAGAVSSDFGDHERSISAEPGDRGNPSSEGRGSQESSNGNLPAGNVPTCGPADGQAGTSEAPTA